MDSKEILASILQNEFNISINIEVHGQYVSFLSNKYK